MRPVAAGLVVVAFILPGCTPKWLSPPPPPDRGLAVESMTAEKVVTSLNANAARIQALRTTSMDITTTVGLQSFNTRGNMVFQKPHNLRLSVSSAIKQEADIGSNDQEFWWWISRDDPPYLYHVTHADFAASRGQIRLPFQPDWIIEALGVGEYDPHRPYQLTGSGNAFQLVEVARAPDGQTVRKITRLSRNAQNEILVTAHEVRDARNNQEIFSAKVTQVQRDQQRTGAILPKVVELRWPAQRMSMTMRLNDVTVNPELPPPGTSQLFVRPNLVGVRSYDLARGGVDGPAGQLQRAGGVYR
jgi:hypothetical protein